MARPKTAKTERTCLVCGGITNVAHLGLDICRACTVFYRRSRNRKFTCRTTTNNCPIGEGVNCRKCRLAEMERMLGANSTARAKLVKEEQRDTPISPEQEGGNVVHDNTADVHALLASPSTSTSMQQNCACDSTENQQRPRKLLEKLRKCYKAMSDTRLAGELASRKDPPHPLAVVDGEFAIIPATFGGMQVAHQILLTALLQFGSSAFHEFDTFSRKDRWTIVTNFFTRYRGFECEYRSDKAFKDDMHKAFAGYTTYFAQDVADHFFDDCPQDGAFREEAKKQMKAQFKLGMYAGRVHMRSVSLRNEEFLALMAFMFWHTDGLDVSEEVKTTSASYKETILKELHAFYREEMKLNDYATRLGELMVMMQAYEEKSVGLDKHFEIMRLLNIFKDDTLIYRLA